MLSLPGNREMLERYMEFRSILQKMRDENPLASPNGYYPYGTLDIVPQVLAVADRYGMDLKTHVTGKTILDLGCGDGDLSLFFERFGASRVLAIDAAAFNYNGMEACRILKKALNSKMELLDADVHSLNFDELPAFDVGFCFGFLYHSRHPLWVLENLAKATQHLFLTTKVFDHEEAFAYFYDVAECNNDDTNWWCFSPKALALMLRRTGFDLLFIDRLDQNVGRSHPVAPALDGRAFVGARRRDR
jgi:2-polyprenyl-3-methyl-5-hydroxy-6-metoxy-1,4-benzoquinol methylase